MDLKINRISIRALALPYYIKVSLADAGINTVGELANKNDLELQNIDYIDEIAVEKIRKAVNAKQNGIIGSVEKTRKKVNRQISIEKQRDNKNKEKEKNTSSDKLIERVVNGFKEKKSIEEIEHLAKCKKNKIIKLLLSEKGQQRTTGLNLRFFLNMVHTNNKRQTQPDEKITFHSLQDFLGTPIIFMNYSVRTENALIANGVKLIGHLIRIRSCDFLAFQNLGQKSGNEIERSLERLGKLIGRDLGLSQEVHEYLMDNLNKEERDCSLSKKNNVYNKESSPITPIDNLDIPDYLKTLLKERSIHTVEQLKTMNSEQLSKIRGMGKGKIGKIKKALRDVIFVRGKSALQETRLGPRVKVFRSVDEFATHLEEQLFSLNRPGLSTKEKKIINSRCSETMHSTLSELATIMSITRERVRQIEVEAIKKIYRYYERDLGPLFKQIKERHASSNNMCVITENPSILKTVGGGIVVKILCNQVSRATVCTKSAVLYDKKLDLSKIDKGLEEVCAQGRGYNEEDFLYAAREINRLLKGTDTSIVPLAALMKNRRFTMYNGKVYYKKVSTQLVFEEFIKEQYPNGILICNELDKLKKEMIRKGYRELAQRTNSTIQNMLVYSSNMVLWGWGVYTHIDNVDVEHKILKKVDSWIESRFKMKIKKLSLWGGFDKYEEECKKAGIPNEHALYSCMKKKYSDKHSFIKDPFVYPIKTKVGELNVEVIERYLIEAKRAINKKEILHDLGLKDYQFTQAILRNKKVVEWGDDKVVHVDNINIASGELSSIAEYINTCLREVAVVTVNQVWEDFIRLSKNDKYNMETLYGLLKQHYSDLFEFPSFPVICSPQKHLLKEMKKARTLINELFSLEARPYHVEEIKNHLKAHKMNTTVLSQGIDDLCPDIVCCDKEAYIALDTLEWTNKEQNLLKHVALNLYDKKMLSGDPVVLFVDFLKEVSSRINLKAMCWNQLLLKSIVKRTPDIKIIGTRADAFIVIPNQYSINTEEDVVLNILKKKYNGCAKKEELTATLDAYGVENILRESDKYVIDNDVVYVRSY